MTWLKFGFGLRARLGGGPAPFSDARALPPPPAFRGTVPHMDRPERHPIHVPYPQPVCEALTREALTREALTRVPAAHAAGSGFGPGVAEGEG